MKAYKDFFKHWDYPNYYIARNLSFEFKPCIGINFETGRFSLITATFSLLLVQITYSVQIVKINAQK